MILGNLYVTSLRQGRRLQDRLSGWFVAIGFDHQSWNSRASVLQGDRQQEPPKINPGMKFYGHTSISPLVLFLTNFPSSSISRSYCYPLFYTFPETINKLDRWKVSIPSRNVRLKNSTKRSTLFDIFSFSLLKTDYPAADRYENVAIVRAAFTSRGYSSVLLTCTTFINEYFW